MIIFSDSRDPIFKSRDPIRVPKTPQITLILQFVFKCSQWLNFGMLK